MNLTCVRAVVLIVLFAGSVAVAAQTNSVPFLTQSLSPVSIAPGSGAFTLTVNGTGFASTAVVNWNGSPRLTEVISSSQLKASIGGSDVATEKTASTTVTNPAPGGGTSNVVFFPVTKASSSIGMAISQAFPNAAVVVTGDFNNDGNLDVAWVTSTGINVSLGNGKGGFQLPIVTSGGFDPPTLELITGDFNSDGKMDLAGADCCGDIVVLLGNGDGTFKVSWRYLARGGGNYIATADFSRDGHLDLYVEVYEGTDLGGFDICPGVGDGTFSSCTENYTGYFPLLPTIGDFNGDGILDLAIPEGFGTGIDIWLGLPSGGFQELSALPYSVDLFPGAGDLNHDGYLDLIDNAGCVFLGQGNGNFTAGGCGSYPGNSVAGLGDFNGDGNLDVATLGFQGSSSTAVVQLGAGDGTFPTSSLFAVGGQGGRQGAIGDFNNDGKLDIVTSDGYLLLQTTVDLTPVSMTFGGQNVGTTSAAQTATLTNVGASALIINKISITGTNLGAFAQTNTCGTSLGAGASCTISVTFAPKVAGALAASLAVSYKGTASPQKVTLSGIGVAPPTVSLTPRSLTFATQLVGTTSAAQTATLTNTGQLAVTISSIATSGAFSETNNCPSSLGVGTTCQIQVVFTPTVAGMNSGTLSVTDNAMNSPQKVMLRGAGTVLSFSPVGINFGDKIVGTTSATAPITLTNTGTTSVAITLISITGANAADFAQTNNCGTSLAANSSCTINVTFKPTATGARAASVTVTDNGGGSPQRVTLTGTGT